MSNTRQILIAKLILIWYSSVHISILGGISCRAKKTYRKLNLEK